MKFEENLKEYLNDEFIHELLLAQEKERTNSLILNTSKMSAQAFKTTFPNIKEHPFLKNVFYYNKNEYQFGKSYLFDNGAYYLIDASSLLVSYYLPTKNGDLLLDLCSAPGGKTISLLLNNLDKNLNVIANDLSHQRALELSKNIERQGFSNVIVTNNDFSKIYKFYQNKFNAIILDAPCSGSAMFRKNSLAKEDWTINKVLSLQERQKELIKMAHFMLKEDGYLIYSTCSFSKEENEDVVLDALNNFNDLEIINIENKPYYYKSELLPEAIHLFPNLYDGEGQFIALLHKKGASSTSINKSKNKITHKDLLNKYELNFQNEININKEIYLNNFTLDLTKLNLIRPGLHLGSLDKNIFIPSFHLAHYLNPSLSIALTEDEFKKYIHGEEIIKNCNLKNDFYVVSYNNINLGFAKYVSGRLKNYYPKGLRH